MGKQQPPPANSPAMSAPPRRRKKKGRPSLLDLQKRSLRLEKLHEPLPPPPPQNRCGTRRNPNPSPGSGDDAEAEEGGRREKKLRLVMRLPDESAKGEKTGSARKATDGLQETSDSGPTTPLPDKKLLVFILDRLQKKDTYGVFTEPVDPEELPDYHDIIKHPMDFSTIRKRLDKGDYANLEQFEDDVFLISSNAMCYNSPDTIYYRQARAIQELAKKDFQNLRQDSDASEPEPEPEPELEPEQKPQPRRGRPPNKNTVKQKVVRPPAERATADFSGATLANAGNNGRLGYPGFNLAQKGMDKATIADALRAYGIQNNENNWSDDRRLERNEDYSGSGSKGLAKLGKRPLVMDESRRNTYNQPQPSSFIYELPVSTSYNGTRKFLVPVGVQLQQSYSRSLARFAAQLGPVGWTIAARRIERILPPGTKFGRGWVGNSEAPETFQPPVLTSSACTAASSEPPANSLVMEEGRATTSRSAEPQTSAAPSASTSTSQTLNSPALASQQRGSLPQNSRDRGEQGVEAKGTNYNLHERLVLQPAVNGFNAAPGSIMVTPTAQLVASLMQRGED